MKRRRPEDTRQAVPPYVQALIDAGAPIDRGWAWVVCFAAFLLHILIAGLTRASGIIFINVLVEFDGTKAETSALVTVFVAGAVLAAPLANWLSQKITPRMVILIGGFLTSFGLGLSSFMRNLSLFILVFSGFAGVGYGFLFTPSIAVVSQYFAVRRSLAVGISMCGSGVGAFIVPPLLNFLIDRYTFRGALFIMSAVFLNILVSASLMRPFRFYTRHSPPPESPPTPSRRSNTGKCFRHPLLRNPRLYIVAFSMAVLTEGSPMSYMLIPPFASDLNVSRARIPMLLLMMGVPDIIGRISVGWFADKGLVKRWKIVAAIGSFEAVMWLAVTFLPRFETLAVFAVLMGAVGGSVMAQFGPVVADAVGIANINAGLGFTMLVKIIMFPVPILLGAIRDISGEWVWSYRVLASLFLASSLLLLLNKCIDERRPHPREDPEETMEMDPVEDLIVHKSEPS